MAYIISADELKKSLPGYHPDRAEEYHHESAKLADKALHEAITRRAEDTMILMAGGAASGKSEYVSVYLEHASVIVVDGTLPTFSGAKIKIDRALRNGKQVAIHLIIPYDISVAFATFLGRDRKFASRHFYHTHSSSRETVLKIFEKFPDVKVFVIESRIIREEEEVEMYFRTIKLNNRAETIEFLKAHQYSIEQIIRLSQGLPL